MMGSIYERDRKKGIIALLLSMIIPVIYVAKNLIFEFDIATLSQNGNDYNNTSKAYMDFEPLLQGLYANVTAVTELSVSILAFIAIYWKSLQHVVFLLPYVICTSASCVFIAGYLLFIIICKKHHSVDTILILGCIVTYAIIVMYAYFVHSVLRVCIALNKVQINLVSPGIKKDKTDLIEIPLPIARIDLPDRCGRKACPSVMYSDLLRKYEPYHPDAEDQEEQIVYRRV